jgi:hypothetical protein
MTNDDLIARGRAIAVSGKYRPPPKSPPVPARNPAPSAPTGDPYADVPPPPEPPGAVIDIGRARKPRPDDEPEDKGPKVWDALDLEAAAQPRWLAANRLPRAAVSLLIGDEGIGKSLLWVLVVAHITTGKPFPGFGIPARDPGRVMLVATEDHWSTAVRPRLEVAGADLSMIRVICWEKDGSGTPIFPRDMPLIRNADPRPDLVIVDCWLDTVPGNLSVRDAQEARRALHPWRDIATETDAAVWLLAHSNRVGTGSLRDRYGATYVLRQKARMTIYAMADGDGLLAGPEKANGAVTTVASRFTITPICKFEPTDEHDGTVPLLNYERFSDLKIRDHVDKAAAAAAAARLDPPADPSDPVGWLVAQLRAGPRWSVDIATAADCDRISPYKLKTAKRKLNVKPRRDGGTGNWYLRLPQHVGQVPGANLAISPPIPQDRQHRQLGNNQKSLSSSKESSGRSSGYMESIFSPKKCGCGKQLTNAVSIRLGACEECRLIASNEAQTSLFVDDPDEKGQP